MTDAGQQLVKYGFFKKDKKNKYTFNKESGIYKPIKESEEYNADDADEEQAELAENQFVKTGFPKPVKSKVYRLVNEKFNLAIEESYFWLLNYLKENWGYTNFDKIIDIFSAAENSAFFGVSQMRLGSQQDKVSQFLATIGKMVKELFQLVRELRIIDERTEYYEKSLKGEESAEITLKGIWIDMVEGGSKNPSSVYGMANEVQFVTLPDLFFSTHPKTSAEVDEVVDTKRAEFNRKVREVLKRKLKTFLVWKEKTYVELKTRKNFTLKYLRQHWDIIHMYMAWVKPYLRYIKQLHMKEAHLNRPEIVTGFETSIIEIEFLAKKLHKDYVTGEQNKKVYSCLLIHFLFTTRPAMSYVQEGYQRGPIHIGKAEITMRSYGWTKEQVENYKKYREEEDLELLKSISGSVKAAMEALGDELVKYLEEAGEKNLTPKKEETKEEPKRESIFAPFAAPFSGLFKKKEKEKKQDLTPAQLNKERDKAEKEAFSNCWETYKNYKKGHGFLAW